MAYHPDGLKLVNSIRESIADLLQPLEEIESELWEEGDDPVDPVGSMFASFFVLGLRVASADSGISEAEAALMEDVANIFRDEDERITSLSTADLKRAYEKSIRSNPAHYRTTKLPFVVDYLRIYKDAMGRIMRPKLSQYFSDLRTPLQKLMEKSVNVSKKFSLN